MTEKIETLITDIERIKTALTNNIAYINAARLACIVIHICEDMVKTLEIINEQQDVLKFANTIVDN